MASNGELAIVALALGVGAYLIYQNSQSQQNGTGSAASQAYPQTTGTYPNFSDYGGSTGTSSTGTGGTSGTGVPSPIYPNPSNSQSQTQYPISSILSTLPQTTSPMYTDMQLQNSMNIVNPPGYNALPTLPTSLSQYQSELPGLFQGTAFSGVAVTGNTSINSLMGILNPNGNLPSLGASTATAAAKAAASAPQPAPTATLAQLNANPTTEDMQLFNNTTNKINNIASAINMSGINSAFSSGSTLVYNNSNGSSFRLII